jgi:hypothetical protein
LIRNGDKKMKRIFSLLALTAFFSLAAFADVRLPDTPKPTPPKEKKSIETRFSIRISRDAKEARLLIPKEQLRLLRAELDAPDEDSNNAAFLSFSRTQTIASGLFLSLAAVCGGVWFSRSRRGGLPPNKAVAAGALLFFGGAFAAAVFANVGPPPDARRITGRIFTDSVHMYKQASGEIKLETTEENFGIQLIVPDMPPETK